MRITRYPTTKDIIIAKFPNSPLLHNPQVPKVTITAYTMEYENSSSSCDDCGSPTPCNCPTPDNTKEALNWIARVGFKLQVIRRPQSKPWNDASEANITQRDDDSEASDTSDKMTENDDSEDERIIKLLNKIDLARERRAYPQSKNISVDHKKRMRTTSGVRTPLRSTPERPRRLQRPHSWTNILSSIPTGAQ